MTTKSASCQLRVPSSMPDAVVCRATLIRHENYQHLRWGRTTLASEAITVLVNGYGQPVVISTITTVLNQPRRLPDSCRHYCFSAAGTRTGATWYMILGTCIPFYVADGRSSAVSARLACRSTLQVDFSTEQRMARHRTGDFILGWWRHASATVTNHMINHPSSCECTVR